MSDNCLNPSFASLLFLWLSRTNKASVFYQGKGQENEQAFVLKMTEDNLTVSWDSSSQMLDNLKEYVVQYKQAGRPRGQAFDWIRVNKSHTSAFMTGLFDLDTLIAVHLKESSLKIISHLSTNLFKIAPSFTLWLDRAVLLMFVSTYRSISKLHTLPSVTVQGTAWQRRPSSVISHCIFP